MQQMSGWVSALKIYADEDVVDELEDTLKAFVGMLEDQNLGKMLVCITHPRRNVRFHALCGLGLWQGWVESEAPNL